MPADLFTLLTINNVKLEFLPYHKVELASATG